MRLIRGVHVAGLENSAELVALRSASTLDEEDALSMASASQAEYDSYSHFIGIALITLSALPLPITLILAGWDIVRDTLWHRTTAPKALDSDVAEAHPGGENSRKVSRHPNAPREPPSGPLMRLVEVDVAKMSSQI